MRNLRFAHKQENHQRREVFDKITQYAFPLSNKLVCVSFCSFGNNFSMYKLCRVELLLSDATITNEHLFDVERMSDMNGRLELT
jgi:hypothetical protein